MQHDGKVFRSDEASSTASRLLWVAAAFWLLLIGGGLAFWIFGRGKGGSGSAGWGDGEYALTVQSNPSGASLMVNGRLVGSTPIIVDGLPAGVYGVRLEREGCLPVQRQITLTSHSESLSEQLPANPVGALSVEIMPDGAEVLLDGEVVGHTPLKLDQIPSGFHDLLVRKTNCDPYSKRIEVLPGGHAVFSEIVLKDKVYTMLSDLVRSEPQRAGHYIDLGHYLFVTDRIDEAAQVFADGLAVLQSPLDFEGPGYAGREKLSDEEEAIEVRLRREDESRFPKEIDKHRNWPRKDTRTFRQKLEEAQDEAAKRNIATWSWTESRARTQIRRRNYDRAAQVYLEHIAAVEAAPDAKVAHGKEPPPIANLPRAYIGLMEVYCTIGTMSKAQGTFQKFMETAADNGPLLHQGGATLYGCLERFNSQNERKALLEMAEKALRPAAEKLTEPGPKSQCLFDLGGVLIQQSRAGDAVEVLQQSIALTEQAETSDERSLRLGEALRKAGRLDDARNLYTTLKGSVRPNVRESARTGLIYVTADEAKLQRKK